MLRRSIWASGVLHVAVIAAATVAWPRSFELPDESSAVPVDLVTVADLTNVKPSVREAELQPIAQPDFAIPPPEETEIAPPDFDKTPPPIPKEPPKPQEQAKAPVNPARPIRKPPRDVPQKFDVDTVLALLDKQAPKPAQPANAKPADDTVKGLGAQNAFTVDLKDALLSQMRQCWNVPVGSPNPEQLIVQVRVFLAQDGSLAQPPQLEPATRTAAAANPYIRTAAEAALRAINVCEPYKHLPEDKYDSWREIVMTFDPSKMISR